MTNDRNSRAAFTPLETARPAGLLGAQARARSLTGFTLIELLVVIAIIAILSVVVVLVLNPAELMRQARDSNRLQDLASINTALNLFQTDTGGNVSLGTASTTYVSIPDPTATSTLGDQCQGLGLPSLPSGWSYHCAASSTYRQVNGTGWLPVDFTQISFKSPLALLPVDPVNTTSSGNYYTYMPGGSWALTSLLESQRYLSKSAALDGGYDPGRYEVGTDLSLVAKSEGLVGWWNFEEGSGTTANDGSGNGNNGGISSPAPTWTTGKIGGGALSFNGSNNYVVCGTNSSLDFGTGDFTYTAWVKLMSNTWDFYGGIVGKGRWGTHTVFAILMKHGGGNSFQFQMDDGTNLVAKNLVTNVSTDYYNKWVHLAVSVDRDGYLRGYVAGVMTLETTDHQIVSGSISTTEPAVIGEIYAHNYSFNGLIDDVRVYNRALSAAEITAIYNATK
jgi:prepilin-type N-terminal cleavage/methylation domain-containing protein